MAARAFHLGQYRNLLAKALPRVVETPEENERLLAIAHGLQAKDRLSAAERKLLELLLVLIEKFEEAQYSTANAKPYEILRELMSAREMKPGDLYHVFGSRGTTSEVLRGKRNISKAAAKELAAIFHVSAAIFI